MPDQELLLKTMIIFAKIAYSSHLKDQRKDSVPVNLSSTTDVGLQSSMDLTLFVAAGAVAVASRDSDMGSI